MLDGAQIPEGEGRRGASRKILNRGRPAQRYSPGAARGDAARCCNYCSNLFQCQPSSATKKCRSTKLNIGQWGKRTRIIERSKLAWVEGGLYLSLLYWYNSSFWKVTGTTRKRSLEFAPTITSQANRRTLRASVAKKETFSPCDSELCMTWTFKLDLRLRWTSTLNVYVNYSSSDSKIHLIQKVIVQTYRQKRHDLCVVRQRGVLWVDIGIKILIQIGLWRYLYNCQPTKTAMSQ